MKQVLFSLALLGLMAAPSFAANSSTNVNVNIVVSEWVELTPPAQAVSVTVDGSDGPFYSNPAAWTLKTNTACNLSVDPTSLTIDNAGESIPFEVGLKTTSGPGTLPETWFTSNGDLQLLPIAPGTWTGEMRVKVNPQLPSGAFLSPTAVGGASGTFVFTVTTN